MFHKRRNFHTNYPLSKYQTITYFRILLQVSFLDMTINITRIFVQILDDRFSQQIKETNSITNEPGYRSRQSFYGYEYE